MKQTETTSLRSQPDLTMGIFKNTQNLIIRKALLITFIVHIVFPSLFIHIIAISAIRIGCQPQVTARILLYIIYKPAGQFCNPFKVIRLSIVF